MKEKSKSELALDLQEKIDRQIDKLRELGFEFMYHNNISSIRRKRWVNLLVSYLS